MGCIGSKGKDGHKHRVTLNSLLMRLQRKNKVVPFTDKEAGVVLNKGTPMLSLTRKTEQMVIQQLWAEGIIPKRREGGVEFIIEMGDKQAKQCSHSFSASFLPGVPQCSTVKKPRPVILPPIPKRKRLIAMAEKMERARLNREMKIQERKTRAAKTIEAAKRRCENQLNGEKSD